jgi:uncharacterized OsmC-like protein
MNKSYVSQAKKKAKQYGVEIEVSKRKDKKFHVIDTNIHFGAKGYTDYLIHNDDDRRKRFHDRFKNNPSYSDKKSGLYYSARILW